MSPFIEKHLLLTQEILIHSELIDLNNFSSECLFKLCATIHGPYSIFIISLPADPIVIYYIFFHLSDYPSTGNGSSQREIKTYALPRV